MNKLDPSFLSHVVYNFFANASPELAVFDSYKHPLHRHVILLSMPMDSSLALFMQVSRNVMHV